MAVFEQRGLTGVETFLASGNVMFDQDSAVEGGAVEGGAVDGTAMAAALEAALGFPVPATVRTAEELAAIDGQAPFSADELEAATGTPQVVLLFDRTPAAVATVVADAAARSNDADLLRPAPSDLGAVFWLPVDGVSGSTLERELLPLFGLHTVRTTNTVARLLKKV